MTWGGLRGAVGLALAIQVTIDRAGGEISADNANRVLFFTGGVAALTLIVNASTCPSIVKALGITQLPETKRRMLLMIHRRLLELSKDQEHPPAVTKAIKDMLVCMESEIHHHAEKTKTRFSLRRSTRSTNRSTTHSFNNSTEDPEHVVTASNLLKTFVGPFIRDNDNGLHQQLGDLLDEHAECKMKFSMIPPDQLQSLGSIASDSPVCQQEQDMLELVQNNPVDAQMAQAMNEAFLGLVRSMYWRQMEHGEFRPGGTEAEVLLSSITLALNHPHVNLCDFKYISPFIRRSIFCHSNSMQDEGNWTSQRIDSAESNVGKAKLHTCLDSAIFQILMAAAVIANAILIFMEEELRTEQNDKHIAWLVADIFFVAVFTVEFLLNFGDQKLRYFCGPGAVWNIFDFVLVVMGIIGLTVNCMALDKAETSSVQEMSVEDVSADGRVVRVARVFRVLRLVRLLRLVRYWSLIKARLTSNKETLQIREHMQKICILTCFVHAHVESQKELLEFFGVQQKVDQVEVARCLVQSQCAIYKAVSLAIGEEQHLDKRLLSEVNQVRESKKIAEELEHFVMDAHRGGVITAREAESVLHPLHDHMKKCMKQIKETRHGLRKVGDLPEMIPESEGDVHAPPGPSAPSAPSGSLPFAMASTAPAGLASTASAGLARAPAPPHYDVGVPQAPPPILSIHSTSIHSAHVAPPSFSCHPPGVADFSPPGAVFDRPPPEPLHAESLD
mmetsp:Transcript_153333/g.293641  ORF Transcript_153333/g.293641 Transcript_153333/m.293641 type:complete len:729 (-) Transcript_153333:112-2298(-)